MNNEALLIEAIIKDDMQRFKRILAQDTVREYAHLSDNLALQYAAKLGRIEAVNILLCLSNVRNNAHIMKNEILSHAAENGHFEVVKALLKIDNVREHADSRNNHALRWAARHGNLEVVTMLLDLGFVRIQAQELNNEALYWAAKNGHVEIVKALLSLENVQLRLAQPRLIYPQEPERALRGAVENGHIEVVKLLLTVESVRNLAHANSNKVLFAAVRNGHTEIVRLLLGLNKVRNRAGAENHLALKYAAVEGHIEIINLLLQVKSVVLSLNEQVIVDMLNKKTLSNLKLINQMMHCVGRPSLPNSFENCSPTLLECVKHLNGMTLQGNPYGIAKSILEVHKKYLKTKQLENQNLEALHANDESSMDDKLLKKANTHFNETIRPGLRTKFETFGNDLLTCLEAIELKIQQLILKQIKQAAEFDNDQVISQFIETNQEEIFQNELLMAEARQLFTSRTVASHIAWRCYDKQAENKGWANLFVPPPTEGANTPIFSTRASSNKSLTLKEGSDIVRERAAYYYLLIENEPNPERKQAMEVDLVFYLAEIKRAHNNDATTIDNPSCFPGTLTRLSCIAHKSSLFECSPEKEVILEELLIEQIEKAFARIINQETQKEILDSFKILFPEADSHQALCVEISDSITGVNYSNALDILLNGAKTNLGYSINTYTLAHAKAREIFCNTIANSHDSDDLVEALTIILEKKLQEVNKDWFIMPLEREYIHFFITSLSHQSAVCDRLAALYSRAFYEREKSQSPEEEMNKFEMKLCFIKRQILVNPLNENNVRLTAQCKKIEEQSMLFKKIRDMHLIKSYSAEEIEDAVEELTSIPVALRFQALASWQANLELEKDKSSPNFFSRASNKLTDDVFLMAEHLSNAEVQSLDLYLKDIKACELLQDNSKQIINLVKSLYAASDSRLEIE